MCQSLNFTLDFQDEKLLKGKFLLTIWTEHALFRFLTKKTFCELFNTSSSGLNVISSSALPPYNNHSSTLHLIKT